MAVHAMAMAPSRRARVADAPTHAAAKLGLVVDGAAGLDPHERMDGRHGERDVGHVGREHRRWRAGVLCGVAPAELLGVVPEGSHECRVGHHVRVSRREVADLER